MRFVLELEPIPRIQVGKIWHTLAFDKTTALLLYLAAHANGVSRVTLASLFWGDQSDHQARGNLRQLLLRLRAKAYGACVVEEHFNLRFKGQVLGSLSNITLNLPQAPDFMVWLESQRVVPSLPKLVETKALPEYQTSFVGRELELTQLKNLLADPTQRLLNVIGLGGMGKTRLCIEAVRGLKTVFVALVGVPEHGFALALLQALGLAPRSHSDLQDQALAAFRDWQGVLLLDNFESVLSKENTLLLGQILTQSRSVQCLVSSREVLHLNGETVFSLQGLEPQRALALFAERSQTHEPTWQLGQQNPNDLTALLRFTDGIPLALELIATWMSRLTLPDALASLEHGYADLSAHIPEQQRNLHLILETTWQRLGEAERQTLARFAAFHGGARLDSVLAVTQTSLQKLYNLMPTLIYKTDQGRYAMHEVLRQFAMQKAFDPTAFELHAKHFKRLLLELEPILKSAGQMKGAQRFLEDLDNFRAMWRYLEPQPQTLLEVRDVFFRCWQLIGLAREGASYFAALKQHNIGFQVRAAALLSQANLHQVAIDSLVSMLNQNVPVEEKGIALTILAESEFRIGQYENAKNHVQQALEHHLEPNWLANALDIQGFLAADVDGNEKRGNELMRQSLTLRRQIFDQRGIAKSLISLGVSEYLKLAFENAKSHWLEALEIMQAFGDPIGQGRCLSNLGTVYQDLNQPELARTALEQAFLLRHGVGDQSGAAQALLNLGLLELNQNNPEKALAALQESLLLRQQLGEQRAIIGCQIALSDLRLYPQITEAEQQAQEALEQSLKFDVPALYHLAACYLARVRIAQVRPLEAIQLLSHPIRDPRSTAENREKAQKILGTLTLESGVIEKQLEVGWQTPLNHRLMNP